MFFFVTGPRMLDMTHCAEHVMCYLPTFAMYSGARGVRLCRALVESSRITLKMQKNKKKKRKIRSGRDSCPQPNKDPRNTEEYSILC